MKPTIHFYIRTDSPAKNGSAQVYLTFSISRTQRLKIKTGKFISLRKEYQNLTPLEINTLKPEQKHDLYLWDVLKERAIKGTENWDRD